MESSIKFGWHSEFSLDHFPPESVGGKLKLLVCKKCNNDAGRLYEDELREMMQQMSFHKGMSSSEIHGKTQIQGIPGKYPIKFTVRDDGSLEVDLKPYPRAHSPFVDSYLEDVKNGGTTPTTITIPPADKYKVAKAFLKAAYLYCFHYWGYEFAFSNTGAKIRDILNNIGDYPAQVPFAWMCESIESDNIKYTPLGLCYLQEPIECKCFIVNIILSDLKTGFQDLACILIPGPTNENWIDLKLIQGFFDNNQSIKVSMTHVTDLSITDNIPDGYTKSWLRLQSL